MITRHLQNAPGDWYVDTRCIDCGASRTVAPGLIVEGGKQSVFARQPETADEITMAWRARLLCPTASVRTERHAEVPHGVFPEEMTQDVIPAWLQREVVLRRARFRDPAVVWQRHGGCAAVDPRGG